MKYALLPDRGDGHRYYQVQHNSKSIMPDEQVAQPEVRKPDGTLLSAARPPLDWHHVCVPEAAIADRMLLYGLATEQDALDHIMWEHHIRLNPTMTTQVAQMPDNVKASFDRVWGPGHKAARGLPMTPQEIIDQEIRHRAARQTAGDRLRAAQTAHRFGQGGQ